MFGCDMKTFSIVWLTWKIIKLTKEQKHPFCKNEKIPRPKSYTRVESQEFLKATVYKSQVSNEPKQRTPEF